MILEDRELRRLGPTLLDPYEPSLVQPASIDIRLGTTFRVARTHRTPVVDLADVPHEDELSEPVEVPLFQSWGLRNEEGKFVIHPGEFVLGSTLECITVPSDLCMELVGKSSLARLFLLPHVAAGFFDPGWKGVGTLEIVNLSRVPIILRPGLPICQSRWMMMRAIPQKTYAGRYQGDVGASGSRYGHPLAG